MKKASLITLLLCAMSLTACGGKENIEPKDAVEKTLPALMKNTIDTYSEKECATMVLDIKSFQADVNYGGYTVSVPLSGKVTFGLRNMFTTDASQLQIAGLFENCNAGVSYQSEGQEKVTHEIKDFNFGVYLSGGNLYADLSDSKIKSTLFDLLDDYLPAGNRLVLETAFGNGKIRVDNVLTNSMLPLATKEEITEEEIAAGLKEVFDYVNDEDLKNIMEMTHDTGNDTYNVKFTVTDAGVINRSYANTESEVPASCSAVNMNVEAWTDSNGAFSGAKLNGSISLNAGDEENPITVNLSLDTEISFDLTKYAITNPSFSEFRSATALFSSLEGLLGGLKEGFIPSGE